MRKTAFVEAGDRVKAGRLQSPTSLARVSVSISRLTRALKAVGARGAGGVAGFGGDRQAPYGPILLAIHISGPM